MNLKTLYHGSNMIIKKPEFGEGNPNNDYGLGFYCTESLELAKEWACLNNAGGFANIYTIDTERLDILNLSDEKYSILNWLAILVNNRTFRIGSQIAAQAKEYLLTHFLPDISNFDAIIGYRADDSYFSFAMDFLNNTISLHQLERAMYFGELGEQFMLKSAAAFKLIEFVGSEAVDGEIYYVKRLTRDGDARELYLEGERKATASNDDLFMIDILRREMVHGDARLQRKIPE
jgi:hypothetical protein